MTQEVEEKTQENQTLKANLESLQKEEGSLEDL